MEISELIPGDLVIILLGFFFLTYSASDLSRKVAKLPDLHLILFRDEITS